MVAGGGLDADGSVSDASGAGVDVGVKPDVVSWLIHCVASCGRTIANTTTATPMTARVTSVTRPTAIRKVFALARRVTCAYDVALVAAAKLRPELYRRHILSSAYSRFGRNLEVMCRAAYMSRFIFSGSWAPFRTPATRMARPAGLGAGLSSMNGMASRPFDGAGRLRRLTGRYERADPTSPSARHLPAFVRFVAFVDPSDHP